MMKRLTLTLPLLAAPLAGAEEYNAVEEGRKSFEALGCAVCHVVAKNDDSLRTGPSLYGLFLNDARMREVANPQTGATQKVKADRTYFDNSVRKSWDVLAVGELGEMKGKPYPAAMPMYPDAAIPKQTLEDLWHYLRTLADEGQAGPQVVTLTREKKEAPTNLLEIPNEVLVTNRTRVFRAPLRGSSARALHVGLPNGMNYTFDPRVLAVRNVWGGGFLNLSEERKGRGKPGSKRGKGAQAFIEGTGIIRPVAPSGEPVDFEFKEPDVMDFEAIEKWLWEERDFPELQASVDAEFLGHEVESASGDPVFRFRVGENRFAQKISFTEEGRFEIALHAELKKDQQFKVVREGLTAIKVDGGRLQGDTWTLRAQDGPLFTLSANLAGGLVARPLLAREETWAPQPLQTSPAEAELPAGYSIESWLPPKDLYGRDQLFEPTGIAVAKDGTIVVATRTAGIWRLRDKQWTLFAEGTYECLGVWIEDDKGDTFVVMQKPEMTRVSDKNGDGRADTFVTVCDDYGFHGNYHEYAHGPVRDAEGNYYFTLNLSHLGGKTERISWRAGGPFMGSMGGYRGWACRVTPEGKFEPYAFGLRSPAGLGVDPEGRLWYAENQGEYVGSSKVVPLEKDQFYGHISGLVTLPGGMNPDSPELKFDKWSDKIRKGAVWLPHGRLANSPGHPAWDQTGGKFGAYAGQMFIGDQTLSTLLRVVVEKVDGQDQGCVVPFARGLASGVMRPVFLPDDSLLLGQTGRGWRARGGNEAALQRIVYDGKTVAADIHRVTTSKQGFVLHFTRPLAEEVDGDSLRGHLKIRSWFYTNTGRYGSPQHDERDVAIAGVKVSGDRKSAELAFDGFAENEKWIDRIYHIQFDVKDSFGQAPFWDKLETYHTLRAIP